VSRPQGHSAPGKIRSIEKSNDLIGDRTRDLMAFSIVPQPTTLPHNVLTKNLKETSNVVTSLITEFKVQRRYVNHWTLPRASLIQSISSRPVFLRSGVVWLSSISVLVVRETSPSKYCVSVYISCVPSPATSSAHCSDLRHTIMAIRGEMCKAYKHFLI
jgi:hypothetical protein